MDQKIEKKRRSLPKLLLGAVLSIGVFFSLTALYQESGTSQLKVAGNRILLDTIHEGVFKEFINIFGTVEPIKTVFLDAVEMGKIEEILVEDGSMVKQGEPILRLINMDLQLEVLNQEAQIVDQISTIRYQSLVQEQQSLSLQEQALEVAYQLDLLSKRTARNQQLYQDKVISQVEFEETQDEYAHLLRRKTLLANTLKKDSLSAIVQKNQMETSVDLMRRNLAFAQKSLENLVVRAPISGQLSSFDAEMGELIREGSRIAQIDVLSDYKVRAQIDEFYISRIFPQQAGSFRIGGQEYAVRIKKIYPEVQNGMFTVDLVFEGERPQNIRRGQSISLKISLSDATQARLLAKGGFIQHTGGNWVYLLEDDGVARRREIQLGRKNPQFYEVKQGLRAGDVVVISSYENYQDQDELFIK